MEKTNTHMIHYNRGPGRPQVLLVGNGLEMRSGQQDWKDFILHLAVDGCEDVSDDLLDSIPFPLLYEIVTTVSPAPSHFSKAEKSTESENMKHALESLCNNSNRTLDMLPSVGADHVFTTNYSYCIEAAYLPGADFCDQKVREKYSFNATSSRGKNGRKSGEPVYKIHSGYRIAAADGKETGIWHIHGQKALPKSVIVGHDKYGSNLSKIEAAFSKGVHRTDIREKIEFHSWPELFVYGDVYILGFGFAECEFDLWWLLRKRQCVEGSDGKVYFYSPKSTNDDKDCIKLLLRAHGVEILDLGIEKNDNLSKIKKNEFYNNFYTKAIEDITERISANRQCEEEERSCLTCP